MSELVNKHKTLMNRVYQEMWNQGKPALAAEIFEEPAGVERFVHQFLEAFPDLKHTVEDMLADGDQIAVRFSARGTHMGNWLEFAPTGKPIHYTGVTWARMANGKITEHDTWWDRARVMEQIGE